MLYVVNIMVINDMECPLLSGYISYQSGRCCGERSWGHKRHSKGELAWSGRSDQFPEEVVTVLGAGVCRKSRS